MASRHQSHPCCNPPIISIKSYVKILIIRYANLALEALNQVTNGHSGGDGVRVDDDVRGDALACEDHVLLPRSAKIIHLVFHSGQNPPVLDSTRSLLSVSRSKFVANLWDPGKSLMLHIFYRYHPAPQKTKNT